jgi:hypothetical protein
MTMPRRASVVAAPLCLEQISFGNVRFAVCNADGWECACGVELGVRCDWEFEVGRGKGWTVDYVVLGMGERECGYDRGVAGFVVLSDVLQGECLAIESWWLCV